MGERERAWTFAPMAAEDARAIIAWRYDGPYAVYTSTQDEQAVVAELLDPRSPHVAVRDAEGTLAGFFAFGTAAEVGGQRAPARFDEDRLLSVGLGLRPDLTGQRLGPSFVAAGLAFARERFAPASFRLFVLTFNARAIRVYERVGFVRTGIVRVPSPAGEREFLELRRPA
jgi:ribosomal-protein-alanine N-acetyltransferase